MKHIRWQLLLGISLVALSTIFYLIHYALFRDAYHIFYRLIGDIAFAFIEVLLFTVIISEVLAIRERRIIHGKVKHGHRVILQRRRQGPVEILF